MKKLTFYVIIGIILVSSIGIYFLYPNEPSFKTLKEIANFPFLVGYNGTRYFLKGLEPVNLEEKEIGFSLNMDIQIENYSNNIIIFQENKTIPTIVEAENKGEKNGIYSIRNLYINPIGDKKDYPFDEYKCNLTFKSINETYNKIFNYYQTGTITSNRWYMDVYGKENKLFFRFYRVEEIQTYKILKTIGLIYLIINIIALLVYLGIYLEKTKNKILESTGNITYYLGNMIGIPFYVGIISNLIVYSPPDLESKYIMFILYIAVASLIPGAISFILREKVK